MIKIISRYYHSIITKLSVKYQNINNQTNDILSWYFDKPQYCTLVTRRQPATAINGHEYDYASATLVLPHTQNIAGGKISGFERKAFTRQNFPDSKVFGFKVPTLDSGFKISGDMTKPGCFHFGFVLLCVNGKSNPVLKRSGFMTNPEQFPLV